MAALRDIARDFAAEIRDGIGWTIVYRTGRSWNACLLYTSCNSVFLAVIPSPSTPVIPDLLTSCMVGGILAGFASGLVLTCGCSTGGRDILGPVSYTHLDVYKRQVLYVSEQPVPLTKSE